MDQGQTMRVLVTCPPMLGVIGEFEALFAQKGVTTHCPEVTQALSERELVKLVPNCDGWIFGDDPATRQVFEAGKEGALRAAVKWGVGVDNVDFAAAEELGIPVRNTPAMFGREVADVAMSYVTALARETVLIDREVRDGRWPKPRGMSLKGKAVALVGYGDIGRNFARRATASEMKIIAYDPAFKPVAGLDHVERADWPDRLGECDLIVLTCALTENNWHMLNARAFERAKDGVRLVNVARGALIDQDALIGALQLGKVHSAALDVMEVEPLPQDSKLRDFEKCIFGSHNSSNTTEAVRAASVRAIELLFDLLGVK